MCIRDSVARVSCIHTRRLSKLPARRKGGSGFSAFLRVFQESLRGGPPHPSLPPRKQGCVATDAPSKAERDGPSKSEMLLNAGGKRKKADQMVGLERETRFELATSTLARLHSTTELLPHTDTKEQLTGAVKGKWSRKSQRQQPASCPLVSHRDHRQDDS